MFSINICCYIWVPGIKIVVIKKDGDIMLLMAVRARKLLRVEKSYTLDKEILLL